MIISKALQTIASQLGDIVEHWNDEHQTTFTAYDGAIETPSFDELQIQFAKLAKHFADQNK